MPEIIFVCLKVGPSAQPAVPSRREQCGECGAEVWMSAEITGDAYVCVDCALMRGGTRPQILMHPLVRDQLRSLGWSDDDIERAHETAARMMGGTRG